MRKFTKCLLTLAMLCIAGVTNAKERVVYSLDYSTLSTYEFWNQVPDQASLEVDGESLVITNNSTEGDNWSFQFFIADNVPTAQGCDYKVNITYKSSVDGAVTVALGTWSSNVPKYGTAISASDDWQVLSLDFKNFVVTSNENHVMWQSRAVEGVINIKSVEIIETYDDTAIASEGQDGWEDNILTNADFSGDDFSCYRVKEDKGEISDPTIIVEDGDNVIKITKTETRIPKIDPETGEQAKDQWGNLQWDDASAAWNTQFWIQAPEVLPIGTKFLLKFDYKADNAGVASTQAHELPGNYIFYDCGVGNINFAADEWKSFEKEITVTSNMGTGSGYEDAFQSIAFNLNEDADPNVYYFKNISLQLPHMVEAVSITIGSIGWGSYCCFDEDVNLGETKGYAAVFNGKSVDLIPVTQVPAGEAVLIEGAGKQTFEVISGAAEIDNNDLEAYNYPQNSNGKYYALANGSEGIGFYPVKEGEEIPAGKAFLDLSDIDAPAFVPFNDGTTSISEKTVVKNNAEGVYYNLAGQRVAQPTKGLYIVNGKKVIK